MCDCVVVCLEGLICSETELCVVVCLDGLFYSETELCGCIVVCCNLYYRFLHVYITCVSFAVVVCCNLYYTCIHVCLLQ